MKYTFCFEQSAENRFRGILSRLEEGEYTIIEDMRLMDHKPEDNVRYVKKQMVIDMEPDAALSFRLGMKELDIRRERTAEELAEEEENKERNTIRINVHMPPMA